MIRRDVDEVYRRVTSEVEAYRSGSKSISEEDMSRAVKLTWGMCAQVWNSTTDIGDAFLDYELVNSDLTDLPEILSSITVEDLKRRLEISYREEYFALAAVKPSEEEDK